MPLAYEHRRGLPLYQPDDRALLVNFRTLSSIILPPPARSLVLEHCLREHKKRIRLYAAVIMPDHVHLLFTPLRDQQTRSYHISVVMQTIKGVSSHSVNKLLGRTGPVWQEEYFDQVVRSYESLRQKIEYIRQNPVRRGLARVPEEYPWLWAEYEVVL
jgi:REP element-mobilizing transposase RayT